MVKKKNIEKSTVVTKLNCFKNFNAIHEISGSQIKDCDLTAIQIVKKNLQFHKIYLIYIRSFHAVYAMKNSNNFQESSFISNHVLFKKLNTIAAIVGLKQILKTY